jgi:DNA-binding NtrC family response regulator
VFPIEMPPLRERKQDIPLLVQYFTHRYARQVGKAYRRVDSRTVERLVSYPWPGNVRELQNVIERSVILCDGEEFSVDESWLSAERKWDRSRALPKLAAQENAQEKTIIEEALRASGGRVYGPSGAAERLGVPRSTLESRIRKHGIDKSGFRPRPLKESR